MENVGLLYYLKTNHGGSFAIYLKKKYAEYKNLQRISDADFMVITIDEWEDFKKRKQLWNEL